MEAAIAAAASAAAGIIQAFGANLVQHGQPFVVNALDRIGFDLDTIGRSRMIQEVSQTSMMEYANRGINVNIMVWNMHLHNTHNHTGLLQQFTVRMGNGGGFCVEIFTGAGDFSNHGDLASGNWRGVGKVTTQGDYMRFEPQ